MLWKLLKLEWRGFRRAPHWGQSMAVNVIMGFFAAYMLLSALAVGFMGGFILKEYFPDENVISKFNGFFVYYLLVDILSRFLLQKFPSFSLVKFLTLNIKKSTICRFLLTKSAFSFFNILPLFVVVPFFFTSVIGGLGIVKALIWLAIMITLVLINNFLSFWLDRTFNKQPIIAFLILAAVAGLIYVEYKGIFSMSSYSAPLVGYMYESVFFIVPATVLGGIYYFLYNNLLANAYLDAGDGPDEETISDGAELAFLDSYGEVGQWLRIESKLIWRNKKSRNYLFMSFIFLVYPFAFGMDWYDGSFMIIVFALIMVGGFMLNYGQLLFSWNSSHFDFIITQNLSIKSFLKAKYVLIAGSNLLFFILTLPYVFLSPRIVLVTFVMMLFNAGILSYFYLWFTMNNSKKMSLAKGNLFNQEGISAAHYFIMLPILALPFIVYLPFQLLGYENLGLLALALFGLLGIVFNDQVLAKAIEFFKYKKYFLHNNFAK